MSIIQPHDLQQNKDWFRVLAHPLSHEEATHLLNLTHMAGNGPLPEMPVNASATGKLLDFYIRLSAARIAPETATDHEAAVQEMHAIQAALEARAADPEPRVTPTPAAAQSQAPTSTQAAGTAVDVESGAMAAGIRLVYKLTVRRDAVDEEVEIWRQNFRNGLGFHEFLVGMHDSEEAQRIRAAERSDDGQSTGAFVIDLFRIVQGRGCNGYELDAVRRRLESGGISRQSLMAEFYAQAVEASRDGSDFTVHDGLSCSIMGTPGFLSLEEWQERGRDTEALAAARDGLRRSRPYRLSASPGVRVSAIASLFRGGDFIEQFMDNITTQTIFDRSCELIIVDAASDENEAETIRRYLDTHPGVRYQRMNSRVGIYEAWNIGVEMARGEFLTNTNLDDLRRQDSLEIQAGALEALPFVDVVYQDFYYSFDPTLDWDGVAAFGYKSELPLVTNHNMLRFNSPHNAPMWRKTLHDELGLFDANFKSAGDYEFWLRCLAAGKTFHKINEPHVVYYQNPKGLSTRADTRGILEAKEIGRKYTQALMPAPLLRRFEGFIKDDIATGLDPASFPARDRHVAVQKALRDTARQFKTGGA